MVPTLFPSTPPAGKVPGNRSPLSSNEKNTNEKNKTLLAGIKALKSLSNPDIQKAIDDKFVDPTTEVLTRETKLNDSPKDNDKIISEIVKTCSELTSFAKKYAKNSKPSKKSKDLSFSNFTSIFIKNVLSKWKYLNNNTDNIKAANEYLKFNLLQEFNVLLGDSKESQKRADNLLPGIVEFIQWFYLSYEQWQFSKLLNKYKEFQAIRVESSIAEHNLQKMKIIFDQLHEDMEEQKEKLSSSGLEKTFIWFFSFHIEQMYYIPNRTADKLSKFTIDFFKKIRDLGRLWDNRSLLNQWLHELKFRDSNPNQIASKNKTSSTSSASSASSTSSTSSTSSSQITQAELIIKLNDCWESLIFCSTIAELKAKCAQMHIPMDNLPPTIIDPQELFDNPQFKKRVARSYLYSMGVVDPSLIEAIYKREKKSSNHIDHCYISKMVKYHIEKCNDQKLSWDDIKTYFANQNIPLNSITWSNPENPQNQTSISSSPQTIDEWNELTKNEAFCSALADKWLHNQDVTMAKFIDSIDKALHEKLKSEGLLMRTLLHFLDFAIKGIELNNEILGIKNPWYTDLKDKDFKSNFFCYSFFLSSSYIS